MGCINCEEGGFDIEDKKVKELTTPDLAVIVTNRIEKYAPLADYEKELIRAIDKYLRNYRRRKWG